MKNTIIIWIGFTAALFLLSQTAHADKITKTFEFGPGTDSSMSSKRTFAVPCEWKVTAIVNLKRDGDSSSFDPQNDVPVVIELRSPGASAGEEGPIEQTKPVTATKSLQWNLLWGAKNERGCDLVWIVRVRPKTGQSPQRISGSISVSFDEPTATTYSPSALNLGDGQTFSVNIETSDGLFE